MTNQIVDDECDIVWLRPPETVRYVRVTFFWSHMSAVAPGKRWHRGIDVVGYAVATKRERSRVDATYQRRLFYQKTTDPWAFDGCPSDAVDPLTLAPNKAGERTPRAETFVAVGAAP